MGTLTIRNVDEVVHERLRRQAAERGSSVEAEVRRLLDVGTRVPERNFLQELRHRIGDGGADLDPYLPARDELAREVDFG